LLIKYLTLDLTFHMEINSESKLETKSILIVEESFNLLLFLTSLNLSLSIYLISIGLSLHLIPCKISSVDKVGSTLLTTTCSNYFIIQDVCQPVFWENITWLGKLVCIKTELEINCNNIFSQSFDTLNDGEMICKSFAQSNWMHVSYIIIYGFDMDQEGKTIRGRISVFFSGSLWILF